MYNLHSLTLDQYFEIITLAKTSGKVAGDSMQEEFDIIIKKYSVPLLGVTDKDVDLVTGELRNSGLKILNLNELERQNELKKEKENES